MRATPSGSFPAETTVMRVGGALVAAVVVALAACTTEVQPPAADVAPWVGVYPMAPPGGALPLAKHCSSAPKVVYNGGPVLQNAKVYEVNWGTHISATVTQQLPQFYTDVVASPYFDWLSEYDTIGLTGPGGTPGSNQGISRGSFAGSVTIVPSFCAGTGAPGSCAVTDAQVRQELVAQMAAGFLPAPTKGCDGQPDTVYMVNFDSSVQVSTNGETTCVNICAYHGTSAYKGQDFAYAVLTDLSTGPCAGAGCGLATNTVLQNTTAVASHELAEATTDGLAPLAWTDPTCGEIADICLLLYGTIDPNGTTWTVQQLWSNAINDCITTKASLPAVCTGANTPAGCRPCACSDDNQGAAGEPGCSGATPACEVGVTNIKQGFCVQCTSNAECASPTTCTSSSVVATDDTCATVPDAGADSGITLDGGSPQDSGGSTQDGGNLTDSGSTPDSEGMADSGSALDSGMAPDSGNTSSQDAGTHDAGVAREDAAGAGEASSTSPPSGDGGNSATPADTAGCSCRAAGGRDDSPSAAWVGLVLLIGLRLRRRRERGARPPCYYAPQAWTCPPASAATTSSTCSARAAWGGCSSRATRCWDARWRSRSCAMTSG
jgi:MYXO-CTERM domain-containing protein